MNEPDIIAINEFAAARLLSLSVRTLRSWRSEGKGPPYIKIGGRRVGYSVEALKSWIAVQTVYPEKSPLSPTYTDSDKQRLS